MNITVELRDVDTDHPRYFVTDDKGNEVKQESITPERLGELRRTALLRSQSIEQVLADKEGGTYVPAAAVASAPVVTDTREWAKVNHPHPEYLSELPEHQHQDPPLEHYHKQWDDLKRALNDETDEIRKVDADFKEIFGRHHHDSAYSPIAHGHDEMRVQLERLSEAVRSLAAPHSHHLEKHSHDSTTQDTAIRDLQTDVAGVSAKLTQALGELKRLSEHVHPETKDILNRLALHNHQDILDFLKARDDRASGSVSFKKVSEHEQNGKRMMVVEVVDGD